MNQDLLTNGNISLSLHDNRDTINREQASLLLLTRDDLQTMERRLVPFLNAIRAMQGKQPVILPGERRTNVQP